MPRLSLSKPTGDGVYVHGPFNFHVSGTWDGASVVLEFLNDENTWTPFADGPYTGDSEKLFPIPDSRQVRARGVSVGASTDLYYHTRHFKSL